MKLRLGPSVILLAVACGPEVAPEEPAVGDFAAALHENQGRELLATRNATLAISRAGATDSAGVAFTNVRVIAGYLSVTQGMNTYERNDSHLLGARLRTTTGATVEITRICPHAKPPSSWVRPANYVPATDCSYPTGWTPVADEFEYELSMRTGAGLGPTVCSTSWNRALPVAGIFDATGLHSYPAAQPFSFSCADGVATKCINWGYKPWLGAAASNRHQACTRMARADYCGDASSHTYNGTPVDLYDLAGINSRTGIAGYSFEAGWLSGNRGALCLSKMRWQSLPLGGYCGMKLPDPRVSDQGRYCDEPPPVNLGALSAQGALLFNDSGIYERGLNTWRNGDQRLTTIAGFYGGASGGTTAPKPGYSYQRYEGIITSVPLSGTVPLETWHNPTTGDYLTTSRGPLAGYTTKVTEGYVYGGVHPGGAVRLRSYVLGTEYTTTSGPAPAGYSYFRDEGFLLPLP